MRAQRAAARSSSPRSPPSIAAAVGGRGRAATATRSAPSSSVICGRRPTSARDVRRVGVEVLAVHRRAPRARRPRPARRRRRPGSRAGWPRTARPARRPRRAPATRLAVSAVTCRHAATRTPSSGRSRRSARGSRRSTGICPSAHAIRASPAAASAGSAMALTEGRRGPPGSGRLASSGSGPACTGPRPARRCRPPAPGAARELHAERVEVQPRDLLVEVLGQHVDLLLVLVVLREQLDLGDRLVRERVRHHEARVAGRVAEVQQAALGEHDDRVAVGEDPLVDLRLDVDPLDVRARRGPAMSISLSKWPMLPTIAWCFIRAMWSAVMMSLLPVVVMKMSAVSTTSSSVWTW